MAVTVSTPNNITSPSGNSLAVFKRGGASNFTVKDINGVIEDLKVLGTPKSVRSSGTNIFTSFSQAIADNTETELLRFDFRDLINEYKSEIPNAQITGTIYCTQSACANEVDSATSNYLRVAFNLLVQINSSGQLKTLFSVEEIPASDEPTAQAFDNLKLFVFFDEANITDATGTTTILPDTFQDISQIAFNTKTNITGTNQGISMSMNNGWVEVNLNASGIGNLRNQSEYVELIKVSINGNELSPT